MDIDQKYLPDVPTRMLFLKARIDEGKKQVFGGKIEIDTVGNHSADVEVQEHTIRETKYKINQIIKDIDFYQSELDKLGDYEDSGDTTI
jgi:hypothetical protein